MCYYNFRKKKKEVPFMKKIVCLILALTMSVTLFGCTSKAVTAVNEQIAALGEITLESGQALSQVEEAYAALSSKEKTKVVGYDVMQQARIDYQMLLNKREADEIEKLIHALRPITMNSADALASAEEQYNDADVNVKLQVENFNDLINDFQLYRFLMIDLVEKKITAIGNVTEDSGDLIEEAQKAYDELSEDDQSWVYNAYMLKAAQREYKEILENPPETTAETTEETTAK